MTWDPISEAIKANERRLDRIEARVDRILEMVRSLPAVRPSGRRHIGFDETTTRYDSDKVDQP